MFVKQYNILQKFILLVALGYFIWWLNGGIDDLKYQVYKEKREEVVKMILESIYEQNISWFQTKQKLSDSIIPDSENLYGNELVCWGRYTRLLRQF